jgi:hypothetical protein
VDRVEVDFIDGVLQSGFPVVTLGTEYLFGSFRPVGKENAASVLASDRTRTVSVACGDGTTSPCYYVTVSFGLVMSSMQMVNAVRLYGKAITLV